MLQGIQVELIEQYGLQELVDLLVADTDVASDIVDGHDVLDDSAARRACFSTCRTVRVLLLRGK